MSGAHDFVPAAEHEFCSFCAAPSDAPIHTEREGDIPHVTAIEFIGTDEDEPPVYRHRFGVSCSCGWHSNESLSRGAARRLAESHRIEVS